MISIEPQAVNSALFCDDCLTLIEATPNSGYALADLSDLASIRLYPVEGGEAITIRDYDISINGDDDYMRIQVIKS